MTDAQRWTAMLAREMPSCIRTIRRCWPARRHCPITRNTICVAAQTLRWMRKDWQALNA